MVLERANWCWGTLRRGVMIGAVTTIFLGVIHLGMWLQTKEGFEAMENDPEIMIVPPSGFEELHKVGIATDLILIVLSFGLIGVNMLDYRGRYLLLPWCAYMVFYLLFECVLNGYFLYWTSSEGYMEPAIVSSMLFWFARTLILGLCLTSVIMRYNELMKYGPAGKPPPESEPPKDVDSDENEDSGSSDTDISRANHELKGELKTTENHMEPGSPDKPSPYSCVFIIPDQTVPLDEERTAPTTALPVSAPLAEVSYTNVAMVKEVQQNDVVTPKKSIPHGAISASTESSPCSFQNHCAKQTENSSAEFVSPVNDKSVLVINAIMDETKF